MHNYRGLDVSEEDIRKKLADVMNKKETLLSQITDSDVFFAKERLGLHKATPEEGVSIEVLKNYIQKKYGI